MMIASPIAAHGLSHGAMLVAMGRTMPRLPAISAIPIKVIKPREGPVGPFFFSDMALYFSLANTFIAPAAMNANAKSPWTIHRATFIQFSFFSSIRQLIALFSDNVSDLFERGC